jgi:hypothetical protein
MAIKGKGRARSGRRVIAAPPRPQLVVRKPPIWRRRWVWGLIGGLAVAGILIGVGLALRSSHRKAFREKEATALNTVAGQLVSKFPKDRTESPGNLFVFYPTATADLDKLAKGQLKEADAQTKGRDLSSSATAAQQALASVPVNQLIPQNFTASPTPGVTGKGATRQAVTDSVFLIQQAFQLYGRVGELMRSAATAPQDQRKATASQATALFSQAGQLFDQGLRKILTTADSLGSPLSLTSNQATQQGQASPSP